MVLFKVSGLGYDMGYHTATVFGLETQDMHIQEHGSALLEIDLPSRLWNMKIFSHVRTPLATMVGRKTRRASTDSGSVARGWAIPIVVTSTQTGRVEFYPTTSQATGHSRVQDLRMDTTPNVTNDG